MNKFLTAVLVVSLPWLAGCETSSSVMSVPASPLAIGVAQAGPDEALAGAEVSATDGNKATGMARLDPLPQASRGRVQDDWSDRFAADDDIRVAVEDMPLSQFLHYAFGELLGVNYLVSDG